MIDREVFSYNDFIVNQINNKRATKRTSYSSESGSYGFTQTNNFKEAVDFARYGWESGIEFLRDLDVLHINGQCIIENDLVGSYVDVGRYLNGEPDCMINFVDEIERDKPRKTYYINLGYACDVDGDFVLNYLKEVLRFIIDEMVEYDVKVIGYFSSRQKNNMNMFTEIVLKDFGENVVSNIFAFAFHPSFFRRLYFRYIESKKYGNISGGYGYNNSFSANLDILKKNIVDSNIYILENIQSGSVFNKDKIIKIS